MPANAATNGLQLMPELQREAGRQIDFLPSPKTPPLLPHRRRHGVLISASLMLAARRKRSHSAAWLVALVALGLGSRFPSMPELCVLYLGDVLWGAFFFVLAALVRPSSTTRQLWLAATMTTELIELSQLYQAPWAQALRATPLGGLLLGHAFSWSDTLCVALGTTAVAVGDAQKPKRTQGA